MCSVHNYIIQPTCDGEINHVLLQSACCCNPLNLIFDLISQKLWSQILLFIVQYVMIIRWNVNFAGNHKCLCALVGINTANYLMNMLL